jgi:hypothetical protein
MSGPGDIGGEVSGEEAAWRDLIAHYDLQDDLNSAAAPWPDRENLPDAGSADVSAADAAGTSPGGPGPSGPGPAGAGPAGASPAGPTGLVTPGGPAGAVPAGSAAPADRARIIRAAGDPRSYTPPDEPEEDKYVPVPLPPPAKLDPLAKFAWAGLIGGPAYLLIGVLVGWSISGIAAFAAIAVFIAGFVILVIRLGDGSKRDDDDDGAVV